MADPVDLTQPYQPPEFDTGPPLPSSPFSEGWASGVQGLKSSLYGAGAALAGGFGAKGLEQSALAASREAQARAGESSRQVEDVNSVGSGFDYAKWALGNVLPSSLAFMGATALGRFGGGALARNATLQATKDFAATVGAGVGGMAASTALEAGQIYPEAIDSGVDHPVLRTAIGAPISGSLDYLEHLIPLARLGILGKAAQRTGIVGRGFGGALRTVAKDVPLSMLTEGTGEAGQSYVERLASGQPTTGPGAMSDYMNSFFPGLIGGAMTAPISAYSGYVGEQPNENNQQNVTGNPEVPRATLPPVGSLAEAPSPATVASVAKVANAAQAAEGVPPVATAIPAIPAIPATPTASITPAQSAVGSSTSTTGFESMAQAAQVKTDLANKIAALQQEYALPTKQRAKGRTKQTITKEMQAAKSQISSIDLASSLLPSGDAATSPVEQYAPLMNAIAERDTLNNRLGEINTKLDAAKQLKPEFNAETPDQVKALFKEAESAQRRVADLDKAISMVKQPAPAPNDLPGISDNALPGNFPVNAADQPDIAPLPASPVSTTSLMQAAQPKLDAEIGATKQALDERKAQIEAAYAQRDQDRAAQRAQDEAQAAATAQSENTETAVKVGDVAGSGIQEQPVAGAMQAALEKAGLAPDKVAPPAPEPAEGPIQRSFREQRKHEFGVWEKIKKGNYQDLPDEDLLNASRRGPTSVQRKATKELGSRLELEKAFGPSQTPGSFPEFASGQRGNTESASPLSDGLSTATKFFGNSEIATAILHHGPGTIDINLYKSVLPSVLDAINDDKVVKAVIKGLPVSVVNNFGGKQFSSKSLLDKKTVLINSLSSANVNGFVDSSASAIVDSFIAHGINSIGETNAGQVRGDQSQISEGGGVISGSQNVGGENIQRDQGQGSKTDDGLLRQPDQGVRSQENLQKIRNDPFIKWLVKRGGISARYAEGLTGEKAFKSNHIVNKLFRKPIKDSTGQTTHGHDLSDIATAAIENHWMSPAEANSVDGGEGKISEIISKALRGERPVDFRDEDAQFAAMREAAHAGIDPDALQKSGYEALGENLQEQVDYLLGQYQAVAGEEAAETLVERIALRTEGQDEDFYREELKEELEARFKSLGFEANQPAASPAAGAVVSGGPGESAVNGGKPDGTPNPEARPDLNLTGQTNDEILADEAAQQAALEQAQRAEAVANAAPNVHVDQVDLFNPQGGLFNQVDQIAAPEVAANMQVAESIVGPQGVAQAVSESQEVPKSDQTQSPAFKKWFGDSQVVDEDGEPQVVYHGTREDFSRFNLGKLGKNTIGEAGSPELEQTAMVGHWFSAHPMGESPEKYGAGYSIDLSVYLKMENPLVLAEADDLAVMLHKKKGRALRSELETRGYDGIIIRRDIEFGGRSYIAFHSTQIKSAVGNRGTFDADNPDILFSRDAVLRPYDERGARFAAIGQEIGSYFDRVLGGSPDLQVGFFEQRQAGGPVGRFSPTAAKDIIQIAYNAKSPLSVAAHEGFHRIEARHLTAQDRAVIRRELKKGSASYNQVTGIARQYDQQNDTALADEISGNPREANAYAFQFWNDGRLEAKTSLAKVFQKIKDFLTKIRNFIDGYGFKSMNDIFEAIDRGAYAKSESSVLVQDAREAYSDLDSQSNDLFNAMQRANGTLAPVWYSNLARTVENLKQNSAPASQWKATIKNLKGVKASEIAETGLEDWLDLQEGKVSRQAISDYLNQNGVKVEEVRLGGDLPEGWTVTPWVSDTENYQVLDAEGNQRGIGETKQDAIRDAQTSEGYPGSGHTRYQSYVLKGGENYRELLLTLPQEAPEPIVQVRKLMQAEKDKNASLKDEKGDWWSVIKDDGTPINGAWDTEKRARQVLDGLKKSTNPNVSGSFTGKGPAAPTFKSGHFEQRNILAHVRFNERTDSEDKKVLFLEEIQSDWAQKGKREGFAASYPLTKLPDGWHAVEVSPHDADTLQPGSGSWSVWDGDLGPTDGVIHSNKQSAETGVINRLNRLQNSPKAKPPIGPFVGKTEAWVALAMKRMIRYAAENGFDKVAWTNGDQQAARYDLSRQVKQINAKRNEDGTYSMNGFSHEGPTRDIGLGRVEPSKLADTVGKDLAEKIAKQPSGWQSYQGDDLRVGGGGMKAFYDKIIPGVANQVLKDLGGGKVENVDFSPAWRQVDDLGEYFGTHAEAEARLRELSDNATEQFMRSGNDDEFEQRLSVKDFGTEALADGDRYGVIEEYRRQASPVIDSKEPLNQQGISLTDKLRDKVLGEGVPLFSKDAIDNGEEKLRAQGLEKQAIQDIARRVQSGELPQTQLMAAISRLIENSGAPENTYSKLMGATKTSVKGSLARGYLSNFSTGNNVAKHSIGYKNVFDVVSAYQQSKESLIAKNIEIKLSKWLPWVSKAENAQAASKFIFDRSFGDWTKASPEYIAAYRKLTKDQQAMVEQANEVIPAMLQAEFDAEKASYQQSLGPEKYAEWEKNRASEIQRMTDEGYAPFRRYGNFGVSVQVPVTGPDGITKNMQMRYDLFESQAQQELWYNNMVGTKENPGPLAGIGVVVEKGTRFKPEFDASLSFKQFLDMANRHGIKLTQPEKEKLAKAMITADSTRRNRIFQRKNIPGYSEDGTRVLAEFVINVSNKVAYSKYGNAIQDALNGKQITVGWDKVAAQPTMQTDPNSRVWSQDGENAGYYHGEAEKMVEAVVGKQEQSNVTRVMKMAATMQFLGGSVAMVPVQLTSIPINVVPYLTKSTSYTKAVSTSFSVLTKTMANSGVLFDLAKLSDKTNKVDWVDNEAGLRDAMIRAAQDGTTMDTEIYQMMGMTRGGLMSKSRTVQKSVDAWMFPFRWSEKANRVTTFAAAYLVGKEKLAGDQLYKFAQQAVTDTQIRYDMANRPAIMRNPILALLFTFKTYPIAITELLVNLMAENKKAGVAMLGSLSLLAGINGLPFRENIEDLVDTLAQRFFGQPFNTDRWVRNHLKNASEAVLGSDQSGLLLNGFINSFTDLNLQSRVGLSNIIPGTRIGAADVDWKQELVQMLGPIGSQVIGAAKGAGDILKGNFTEAIRDGGPAAAQNMVKAMEQYQHGYALDGNGQKLADVSGWNVFWQALGFSNSSLGNAYDLDRIDKQTVAFYNYVRADFIKDITTGVRDGDRQKVADTVALISKWNQQYPEMGITLDAGSLRRHIQEAGLPINQRTLERLPLRLRSSSFSMQETVPR